MKRPVRPRIHKKNNNTMGFSLAFAILCAVLSIVDATITVGSGKFPSRMDHTIGQSLLAGYNYMGRLQYIRDNPTLCPDPDDPHRKYTITMSKLPVALLAQAGGCSLLEKAQVAANSIVPANNVQYLIVQKESSKRHGSLNSGGESSSPSSFFYNLPTTIQDSGIATVNGVLELYGNEDGTAPTQQLQTWGPNDSIYGPSTGGIVDLSVLHVSYSDGNALFDIIGNETPLDRQTGGIQIILNNNIASARILFLWMFVPFMVCACFSCCLLVCVQDFFDEEEEDDVHPRRPKRRRLTLDQVRTKFPSSHFNPNEHHQNNLGSINEDDKTEQQPHYTQLSDECTICLDEFTAGVRVRELPCGHVFHSNCIARWLIERTAVCPLCKLDLYEEPVPEEEDETNSDEPSPPQEPIQLTTPPSFFGRLWTTNSGYTRLEVPLGEPAVDPTVVQTNGSGGGEEESRSWWPISVETVRNEEDHRHPRSSPLPGGFFWRALTMIGNRRRRWQQQQPIEESNMLTELTEQVSTDDEVATNNEQTEPLLPVTQPPPSLESTER